jgi:hypothetical protein
MILSGCCAPATVGHDAAAPPRTQRDCRLLMPAPKYVIITARMSALVGLKQASRPYEMLADVRCGVKSRHLAISDVGAKRNNWCWQIKLNQLRKVG